MDSKQREFSSVMYLNLAEPDRIRQYRRRVSERGLDKNVKPNEMKAIVRKRQQRKIVETNRRELVFRLRGNVVDPEKINRWMKRNDVPEDMM